GHVDAAVTRRDIHFKAFRSEVTFLFPDVEIRVPSARREGELHFDGLLCEHGRREAQRGDEHDRTKRPQSNRLTISHACDSLPHLGSGPWAAGAGPSRSRLACRPRCYVTLALHTPERSADDLIERINPHS